MQSKWTLRVVTALLWAVAAGSAVLWALRAGGAGAPLAHVPAMGTGSGEAPSNPAAVARLLGAAPAVANAPQAAVVASSRFALTGVVSVGRSGAALLVVDGKPAKPYRVGSRIDESTLLQSVGPRHAVLAASMDGPPLQRLEMPQTGATRAATVNPSPSGPVPGSASPSGFVPVRPAS